MNTYETILSKLSEGAKAEFIKAAEGMKIADLESGLYVRKDNAEAQKREVENKLKEAQNQITTQSEAIKKAEATGTDLDALKKQFVETETGYQQKLKDMETQAQKDRQTAILKDRLHKAGCKDADYGLFKLNQKDALSKLEFKENGDVTGLTDYIKDLQTEFPDIWHVEHRQGTATPGAPVRQQIANPWKKETFNLTEQGRIFAEDQAKARALATEAGVNLDY